MTVNLLTGLPNEIIARVFLNLPVPDLANVASVSRVCREKVETLEEWYVQYRNEARQPEKNEDFNRRVRLFAVVRRRNLMPFFSRLFGRYENFERIPILVLNEYQKHFTEYPSHSIDYITPEMMSAPVMRGIDGYHRLFVSMKITYISADKETGPIQGVRTYFQRYSPNTVLWDSGGNFGSLRNFQHRIAEWTSFYLLLRNGSVPELKFQNDSGKPGQLKLGQ